MSDVVSSQTNLYLIRARVNLAVPSKTILVQEMVHAGEPVFWIDGVDIMDPLLMPVRFFKPEDVQLFGTFEDLIAERVEDYLELIAAVPDDSYSPSVMARAMDGMRQKPNVAAADILRMVLDDGLALREMERRDKALFDSCMLEY